MEERYIGVSRALADHIVETRYEHLPQDAIHAFKRTFVDFLTCAVAGSAMPVSRTLLAYFEECDATRTHTVIGTGAKLSGANAAMVNGANVHALDFDDGYMQAAAHPGGCVFPAVLAAAERTGASAEQVIAAVVIGYDVMLRIGGAMHPVAASKGFHNTPLSGVFGAAAGVANLLGFDHSQTLNALGLAGSFAGGIREYLAEGAEVKRIHAGKAARDGLICAELAKRGITGPSKVLEGRYGLFHTHVGDAVRWERLLDGIGERFEISQVYFKPYPSCRGTHPFIDAIKSLRQSHEYSAKDVVRVDLGGHGLAVNGHDQKTHDNMLEAQMSIPCAAGLAVVFGDVTTQMFLPETLERPDVEAVIERSHAFIDEECERLYPQRRSAFVRIGLADGRNLEMRLVDPKGEHDNPLTDRDLEEKLTSNCAPLIGETRCAELIEHAWRFEKLPDVTALLRSTSPAAQ